MLLLCRAALILRRGASGCASGRTGTGCSIVQENPDGTFDYAYGTDQEYGIDYKKG